MKIYEVKTIEEKEEKELEISQKIQQYKTAQQYQLEFGGPGPVAEYDIMEIVNEHGDLFDVVVIEETPIE
jgi:hypothetical protein